MKDEISPVCGKCNKEMRCKNSRVVATNNVVCWTAVEHFCTKCKAYVITNFSERIDKVYEEEMKRWHKTIAFEQ